MMSMLSQSKQASSALVSKSTPTSPNNGSARSLAVSPRSYSAGGSLRGRLGFRQLVDPMMLPRLKLFSVLLGLAATSHAAPLQLLTAKQAAQQSQAHSKLPPIANHDAGSPHIRFETPRPGTATAAPFAVKVKFVAADGAKIRPETLKIQVLKIVPISLNSMVKPYVSASGINIPEATIPPGKYDVRVVVADTKGREGEAVGTWVVK